MNTMNVGVYPILCVDDGGRRNTHTYTSTIHSLVISLVKHDKRNERKVFNMTSLAGERTRDYVCLQCCTKNCMHASTIRNTVL